VGLTEKLQGTSTVARSKKPTSPETPDPKDVATPETAEAMAPTANEDLATPEEAADTFREDPDRAGETAPLVLTEEASAKDEEDVAVAPVEPEPSAELTVSETSDADEPDRGDEDHSTITADDAGAEAGADAGAVEAESVPETRAAPEPAPPPAPSPAGSGGFLPLFLGGVAAAALGFAIARYAVPEGWPTPSAGPDSATTVALDEQATRIAALEDRLASLSSIVEGVANQPAPTIDATALRNEILSAIPSPDLSALDDIEARIAALTEQVAALGDGPEGLPAAGDEQIAAIRAEIDSAVAEARTEMEAAQAQARADLEAAQAEAVRVEAEAAEAARRALAEAAAAQVAAALDAGAAFGDSLGIMGEAGVEIPQVLAAGSDGGVPTLPELQEAFPDAARAALDAAIRSVETGTAMDRAMAFLRAQTGARSLTPREGDDPDAVLSRAEAALRAGDLDAALSELEGLPEAGASAMADWTTAAETRQSALAALTELRARIETN
jgi:hypothetical protein